MDLCGVWYKQKNALITVNTVVDPPYNGGFVVTITQSLVFLIRRETLRCGSQLCTPLA